ncbi:MAG: M23 family metallopeptidase [Bacteroidetes bacterium]|nr:M23 family metallopeptidase [Bacteroidota bacterium]
MSKIKYRYNTKSLTYERVETSWRKRILRLLSYLATGTVFATVTILIAFTYFDSPKEKIQKREIEALKFQYQLLNTRFAQVSTVLSDLQQRDDNIYRMIFEAEPVPSTVRKAGYGGVDRYKELEGFENSTLMIETTKRIDRLAKQLYVQSKSFDDIVKMAANKEKMFASIPAIMPISQKKLRHAPSGFGWRTHPIYKTSQFHAGMDFAAPEGTEIYSTGDGVIERADNMAQGYGNHVVVNHGYGYKSLYAHMTKMSVRVGQAVKRGQLLGYVGNTGLSTAPHVHYEIIKNEAKINPINFYYNDLSPAQYQEMIEVASRSSQSFD